MVSNSGSSLLGNPSSESHHFLPGGFSAQITWKLAKTTRFAPAQILAPAAATDDLNPPLPLPGSSGTPIPSCQPCSCKQWIKNREQDQLKQDLRLFALQRLLCPALPAHQELSSSLLFILGGVSEVPPDSPRRSHQHSSFHS